MDTGMCTGASSRSRIEYGSESWAAGGERRRAAVPWSARCRTLFESITSHACRHTCTIS
jgi:hypothetical protein